MTAPRTRRIAMMAAAAALTVAASVGCTAGDWRYEAPPAAGVQADAADAKVRNLMIVTDADGQAIVLGSVATTDPVELADLTVWAQDDSGVPGEPHSIDVSAEIPRDGIFKFEGEATQFENTELLLGRLAEVRVGFGDGRAVTLEAPIYSSEHPDFAEEWSLVYG